jgi:hypothetical protein
VGQTHQKEPTVISDYITRGVQTLTNILGLTKVNPNEAFDDPILDAVNANADILDAAVLTAPVPATAASTGRAGQIAYGGGFLYVCVATNTWQRVAIATF